METQPVAPEVDKRIRHAFEQQGFMTTLKAEIAEISSGFVRITMPARDEIRQHDGYVHAGATTAIADTAGGFAAATLFNEGEGVLAVEFKINFVAPALGEYLEAVGKVIRAGRTLTICQMEVFGVTGDKRTLVAVGQQTLIRIVR
jgi:uncharacterized protein (TIGR00369 family)